MTNLTNRPPQPDYWRGDTFDVVIAGKVSCPVCGAELRAAGTSVFDGETRIDCLRCHSSIVLIEQRLPSHRVEVVP